MLTGNILETKEAGRLSFRAPVANDGPAVHALVERSEPLDLNSRYCYIILCEHFSSTCVVVEKEGGLVGVATAYIPPEHQDTLFLWQVAVDAGMRGQGLAKRMLRHLLSRHNMKRISYVEATVSPSNKASRSLFKSLAKEGKCEMREKLIFPAQMFGDGDHEQENLIRVGPIDSVGKTLIGRKI
ncbi:MAG: diaminobutyrate acetyltransferase [Mariprofundaceae bacterium]|nr:diaminobutyrate acetyltransferase [Mariprofundaceae bacterium]